MTRRLLPVAMALVATLATSLTQAGKVTRSDPCGGALITDIRNGIPVCIHASEGPPPGVDVNRRPTEDELRERRFGMDKKAPDVAGTDAGTGFSAAGGSVACIGDGVEGDRVQAIYARASDVPDRFASVVGLIRQYAADADYQINVSAGASGKGRRVRFVTRSCTLSVEAVTLTSTGDDSFSATRSQLQSKGFNRPDRKYLVWVDASVGICGLGELYADDRASVDNANNGGPSFARVDAPCWGYAEAHELLHTLGAVQDSAPNSTGAGHCFDENDTMCYTDTSGAAMANTCTSMPSWQVDCRLDDYFNAAPASGAYLATHWNVADSRFLEGAPPPPPPPSISVSAPSKFYAGNSITVTAAVSVPAGRTYTVSWSSSRTDCKFTRSTGASNTYYCPVVSAGGGQVTARVNDSLGMTSSVSKSYQLITPSRRRATVASLSLSKRTISRGGSATLTGKLVDKLTGARIIGMKVTIYYRKVASSTWHVAATKTTSKSGMFTLKVKPSRSTYYMFTSWYTSTWASDQSNSRKLGVV